MEGIHQIEFIWQSFRLDRNDQGKENSQGKITAKECDEIIKKLSLKSFEGDYKVLVMWMPEELDKEETGYLRLS